MTDISPKWSCLQVTSISSTSLNSFHGEICVFLNHVKVTWCYRRGYNNVNGFKALGSAAIAYMTNTQLQVIDTTAINNVANTLPDTADGIFAINSDIYFYSSSVSVQPHTKACFILANSSIRMAFSNVSFLGEDDYNILHDKDSNLLLWTLESRFSNGTNALFSDTESFLHDVETSGFVINRKEINFLETKYASCKYQYTKYFIKFAR